MITTTEADGADDIDHPGDVDHAGARHHILPRRETEHAINVARFGPRALARPG